MSSPAYLEILGEELKLRRSRNPAYSLRAYARDLKVSVTALSDVLNRKRNLSNRNLNRVIESLRLPADEVLQRGTIRRLKDHEFAWIADWYCFALLSLAKLPGAKADPHWVSGRLGISPDVARATIRRMRAMRLISTQGGILTRTSADLSVGSRVPSAAVRRHHREKLILAEKSLLEDPMEIREFKSFSFPANPAKIQKARQIISKMCNQVAALLEDEQSSEVYSVNVQLFPLSRTPRVETKVEKGSKV